MTTIDGYAHRTLHSAFAYQSALPDGPALTTDVQSTLKWSEILDWLDTNRVGESRGKNVRSAAITGQPGGILLIAASIYFTHPGPPYQGDSRGRKFFVMGDDGESDVAIEHRLFPLRALPGDTRERACPPRYADLMTWLEPHGIGFRICRPIQLVGPWQKPAPHFAVTEWRTGDDGGFAAHTTRLLIGGDD